MRSVIFDFNGTMYQDKEFHKEAWIRYGRELGFPITEEIFYQHMYGPTNASIFAWLYGRPLEADQVERMAEEKERVSRQICLEHPDELHLTDGLPEALDKMKAANVNMTIATASNRANVDFYRDVFGLDRWFDYGKILCDDGTVPQKPDPAIYRMSASLIGVTPEECMIVEDSMSGYRAAYAAGAGEITLLDTSLGAERAAALPGVCRVIHNFYGFEKLFPGVA